MSSERINAVSSEQNRVNDVCDYVSERDEEALTDCFSWLLRKSMDSAKRGVCDIASSIVIT